MSKEVQEQLNQITQNIVAKFKPERIVLFGSYASGKPSEDSDFDLLVIKNTKLRPIDRDREVRRVLPADRKKGVDLIIITPQEADRAFREKNIFINKLFNEGKELYAKDKRDFGLVKKSRR